MKYKTGGILIPFKNTDFTTSEKIFYSIITVIILLIVIFDVVMIYRVIFP